MPNHKVHDALGIGAVIATAPMLIITEYDTIVIVSYSAGLVFGTLFLSPDLDIHSQIYRRWGILRFIWIPYRKLIKHRSLLSHSGVSVFLRLAYLLFPLMLSPMRDSIIDWIVLNNAISIAFAIGLFISDVIHSVADVITTKIKRKL